MAWCISSPRFLLADERAIGCSVQEADGSSRDAVERDERRLADLGRRCVEMFAAVHIASQHMEVRCCGLFPVFQL